jgi:hypothetical protein
MKYLNYIIPISFMILLLAKYSKIIDFFSVLKCEHKKFK